jgi:hypothetical protein
MAAPRVEPVLTWLSMAAVARLYLSMAAVPLWSSMAVVPLWSSMAAVPL